MFPLGISIDTCLGIAALTFLTNNCQMKSFLIIFQRTFPLMFHRAKRHNITQTTPDAHYSNYPILRLFEVTTFAPVLKTNIQDTRKM